MYCEKGEEEREREGGEKEGERGREKREGESKRERERERGSTLSERVLMYLVRSASDGNCVT